MTHIGLFWIFAASLLAAQDGSAPAQQPTTSQNLEEKPFVRRFSAGGWLSISAFSLMEDSTKTEANAKYTTSPRGHRFGGGGIVQVTIGDKFAIAGTGSLRRVRFETNNELTENSKTTKQNDFSSTDFWEFPAVLRRYNKSRMDSGRRWFVEGGTGLRRIRNVRSSLQTTTPDDKTVCCDERPIQPANRFAAGIVAGAGYQFIDQFGLRFVPIIRYTYWAQPTFDKLSVHSNRHQLEAGIAITF